MCCFPFLPSFIDFILKYVKYCFSKTLLLAQMTTWPWLPFASCRSDYDLQLLPALSLTCWLISKRSSFCTPSNLLFQRWFGSNHRARHETKSQECPESGKRSGNGNITQWCVSIHPKADTQITKKHHSTIANWRFVSQKAIKFCTAFALKITVQSESRSLWNHWQISH